MSLGDYALRAGAEDDGERINYHGLGARDDGQRKWLAMLLGDKSETG